MSPITAEQIRTKQRDLMAAGKIDNDKERRLFQHAVAILQQRNPSTWANARIEIILKDATKVTFKAGAETNVVVIQLGGRDDPQHYYEQKGWGVWLYDSVVTAWNFVRELEKSKLVQGMLAILAGTGIKAVTSK